MSRRNLHNDENFWPCVSDMFLALFVIALVLYSSMSADKGRGDEYISDLAAQEACSLFETLKREHPDLAPLKSINVDEILDEEHGARPKLAEALYSLLRCEETAQYFHVTDETLTKIPDDVAMYRYSDAVALLYKARLKDGKEPDKLDPAHHEHMRKVREHVEFEINKTKLVIDLSHKELADEIRNLERQISNMVEKSIYDDLRKQYKEPLDMGLDPQKWLKVLAKIAEKVRIRNQILAAKIKQASNQTVIDGNGDKINKLEDPRREVMESVKNDVLNKRDYADLRSAGVEVKVDEGIIYIPSTVFMYPEAFIKDYNRENNREKGVVSSELRGRFEDELHKKTKVIANMKLLAKFLSEIGQKVDARELAIDNIAIECYMVDTPSASNEGMILQCSFDAWRMLDMYAGGRLSGYKNEDGQGLFSMSGFIREKKYAKQSGPHMQIRFNCSSKRIEEESASPNQKR